MRLAAAAKLCWPETSNDLASELTDINWLAKRILRPRAGRRAGRAAAAAAAAAAAQTTAAGESKFSAPKRNKFQPLAGRHL
mgnify:CR=1 FL=1